MAMRQALDSVRSKLAEWRVEDQIMVEAKVIGDIPRVTLTKKLNESSRYVQFHETAGEVPWTHVLIFGEYGGDNEAEGRGGGDLAYIENFIRAWLVDVCPMSDLPESPP